MISRIPTSAKVAALTFDDGPSPPYTGQILSLLTHYHDSGTFFVLGNEARRFPQLIRAEHDDHMEVALHGVTHLNLFQVGAQRVVHDALHEQQLLQMLIPGATIHLYRPPFGNNNQALAHLLKAHHLVLVLWNVDTRDWTQPGVGFIVSQVEKKIVPGSIVLFHDGGGNRSQTVAALKILLPWLKAHQYTLVTVSQLIQRASL